MVAKKVNPDYNGYMKRQIINQFEQWLDKDDRKPLVLKGVRQCGKTTSLHTFGRQQFERYHYFNFEKQETLHAIFKGNLEPVQLIEELNFHTDTAIDINNDLVIFDEIQACPRALTSLKYFNEEMPKLALIAAGSLLGIHLNDSSFPVGMVDLLYMYPMSFQEFLVAIDEQRSADSIRKACETKRLGETIHNHIWRLLKHYFITGGLPEVVKEYVKHKDVLVDAMHAVRAKQNALIKNYYADIAKHSGKLNAMHIDRLWHAVPGQLAKVQDRSTAKFQFKGILPTASRYSRLANVIDWLKAAHHIIHVPIVDHIEIPLSAYTKENRFKLFMFDCGILGAMAGISPKTILDYNYGTYKGYFAENFVMQELICSGIGNIYNWQEGRAEVEFVHDFNGEIIPIEVKAGSITQAKSLAVYHQKYKPRQRIILSARNIQLQQNDELLMLPIYMAALLEQWVGC